MDTNRFKQLSCVQLDPFAKICLEARFWRYLQPYHVCGGLCCTNRDIVLARLGFGNAILPFVVIILPKESWAKIVKFLKYPYRDREERHHIQKQTGGQLIGVRCHPPMERCLPFQSLFSKHSYLIVSYNVLEYPNTSGETYVGYNQIIQCTDQLILVPCKEEYSTFIKINIKTW